MFMVRLITLMILLFFASSNIIFARLPFDHQSLSTRKEIGNGVWDQKAINEIKRKVKPSTSPRGGQHN
ncbi:hypothetical protein Bca4012_082489 [Brassica carinata]